MNEPIQEKTAKPPGLVPKNVQSWLLISLALLMVLIMWLTGAKKPQPPVKTANPALAAQAPLEINERQITDLQNRIQELQRQQLVAQSALAQQTRLLAATPQDSQPSQQASASGEQLPERPEDTIQSDRKKREYLSLFASNVALSYRNSPPGTPSQLTTQPSNPTVSHSQFEGPDPAQLEQLLKAIPIAPPHTPAPSNAPSISTPAQEGSPETTKGRKEESSSPAATSSDTHNAAAGKTYVLFEGTVFETVLINRLEGQFAGPVECLLSTDVYSHDRQHLLIPAGTKVLGETKRVDNSGQTRLAVVFHRLIMPDGYAVSLDKFKGLDQIGDTGLRDQVNNHYLRIFGVSLAIGALGAVAEAGTGSALTASGSDLMRQGFASSTAQSSAQILDKFLNILPTVTIREGHRVKVYLSGDLALPDYKNHEMPSDL
jgi:type IV secretory pathway VirB10-like protein